MEVDSQGASRPEPSRASGKTCYECGKEGHFGRDCPVRQARIREGGPPILPKGGKDGKGGKQGKDGKGGGKGGKNGKGWWPNTSEWKQMYPGPTQATWNSWYPHAGQGKGAANLFDGPASPSSVHQLFQPGQALSPLQQLFAPGTAFGAYSIVEKVKSPKDVKDANGIKEKFKVGGETQKSFTHLNSFDALQADDDRLDEDPHARHPEDPHDHHPQDKLVVNVLDAIKPKSRNQVKREARRGRAEHCAEANVKAVDDLKTGKEYKDHQQNEPSGLCHGDSRSFESSTPVLPSLDCSDDDEYMAEIQWDVLKSNIAADVPEYKHVPLARPHRRNRGGAPTAPVTSACPLTSPPITATAVDVRQSMKPLKLNHQNTLVMTPEGLVSDYTSTSMIRSSSVSVRGGMGLPADEPTSETSAGEPRVSGETNEDMWVEKVRNILGQLNVLIPKAGKQTLATAQDSTQPRMKGLFEELKAIVDSGATVPVLHPKMAASYELEESAASRAGVEYEMANDDTLPNLGQKRIAVLTQEGTLRGYQTQCADVSKALQSVRALVASRNAVCFGLGPTDSDHLIINKVTGEVNRMEDDGINYIQRLLIVPPDQIDAVQQKIDEHWNGQNESQGFPGQGR